ncbi:PadR family transcriptional regulator [Hyalangium minutum]|uniref:Transcriptional regulator, PadR family protein n=1 Tax=Hyalangium minutum TaxID=394096 RepID=A0A085WXQ6_9BACT|nr:PadR family transcriptional regulator [Hyalangium minutum]KFE72469.1 Transcriptional regulator, PadR family protein [Hyalangium minutum]
MPTPSSPSADAPLGTFEEQVLLAVLRTARAADGSGAYGMAVRRELEAVTGREVAIGAVYATLDRLEAKGLASSGRGETSGGNSRRVFAVTPRGARALADSREMRERLWRGVDLVPLLAGGSARGST